MDQFFSTCKIIRELLYSCVLKFNELIQIKLPQHVKRKICEIILNPEVVLITPLAAEILFSLGENLIALNLTGIGIQSY